MEWKSKTSKEILAEALFFRLYNSYLLQQPELRDNYAMLLQHYNDCPSSFKILNRHDLRRLKQVQEDIKHNRYSLFSGSLDFSGDIPDSIKTEKNKKKHKDICWEMVERRTDIFGPLIGNTITACSVEHPTIYGPIDILLQDDKGCAFVIELKSDQAKHDILGQVMKYFIAVSLKLNYRLYEDVKIITCAPGYSADCLKGLKGLGAIPTLISYKPLSIKKISG